MFSLSLPCPWLPPSPPCCVCGRACVCACVAFWQSVSSSKHTSALPVSVEDLTRRVFVQSASGPSVSISTPSSWFCSQRVVQFLKGKASESLPCRQKRVVLLHSRNSVNQSDCISSTKETLSSNFLYLPFDNALLLPSYQFLQFLFSPPVMSARNHSENVKTLNGSCREQFNPRISLASMFSFQP